MLHKVFAEFTPLELLGVELVMHQKDGPLVKAVAGRAYERRSRGQVVSQPQNVPDDLIPSTIACVSGFLINMPGKRLRLVTPTHATEQWPDGYKVLDEGTFEDADSFGELIDLMIERNMDDEMPLQAPLRFRPDLMIEPTSDGFIAATSASRLTYSHREFGRQLGDAIRSGTATLDQLVGELSQQGCSMLDVHKEIQGLLANGLLEEQIAHRRPELASVPA